ncbi:MAG: nucleoside recognition domain-containing protein, partial [Candidatus Puniceispirillaceae bacterium]
VAQMSVLASFMLFTHSLPVEALISRKAGVRLRATIGLRVAAGFIMGIFLHQFCQATGWLSEPAVPNLPEFSPDTSLSGWIISQIKGLIFVQVVIIVLLFFLEFLRMIGVERLIKLLLSPFLKLMKIGDRASTIAVVGVTLGLGFGGGLLIRDVATGTIHKRDVFGVLCFINLLHSIFEDTAVVMLLGPSLLVVLAMRTIFAIIMTLVVMMLATRLPEAIWDTQLVNRNIPKPAQLAER